VNPEAKMNDDIDAAADRAAIAARTAVKSQPRQTSRFFPLVVVAFAILSGVYLFMTDTGNPAKPTGPMPVPHVQAPGGTTPAPPAEPVR
jgi:hypothetical protein